MVRLYCVRDCSGYPTVPIAPRIRKCIIEVYFIGFQILPVLFFESFKSWFGYFLFRY